MSPIRENLIEVIESLPYDFDKEFLKRDTKEILKEVTLKYIELFGVNDLSENDKNCIKYLVGNNI